MNTSHALDDGLNGLLSEAPGSDLVAAAREIAQNVSAVHADVWDREMRFPQELFDAMANAGLNAMAVPARLGGLEVGPDTSDPLTFWHVIRELATADSSSAHTVQGHTHAAHAVRVFGSDEQHKKYLGPVVSEGAVYGFWGSEQNGKPAGAAPMSTRAKRVTGGWRVSGKKFYSTNGRTARFGVVFVVPEDAVDPVAEMMLCILDCTSEGVSVNTDWWNSATGMRATVSDEILLDNVFIPDDAVLGSAGDYWEKQIQARYMPSFASNFQGVARHVFDYGREYLAARNRLDSETIQLKFGEAASLIFSADAMLSRTAHVHLHGSRSQSSQAGRYLRSASETVTRRVIELVFESCGASIHMAENPTTRIVRDWEFFSRHENVELIRQAIGAVEFGISSGTSPEDSGFHASTVGGAKRA